MLPRSALTVKTSVHYGPNRSAQRSPLRFKPAGNDLEIDVINLWCNRVMGDALLPPDQRFTKTNITYKKDEPLMESGLIGPVKLQLIRIEQD